MATQTEALWTVTRITEHLEATRHQVEYVIVSRGITPIDRAGIARVYDRRAVDVIAHEMRYIKACREGVSIGN